MVRILVEGAAWLLIVAVTVAVPAGGEAGSRVSRDLARAFDGSTAPSGDSVRHGPASAHRPSEDVRASDAMALAQEGWKRIQDGAYGDANRAFAEAARLAPEDAGVQVGLGFSYQLLADHDRALSALQRAIHLDMSVGMAHGLLGDLYARRGELERALYHYRIALDQVPSDSVLQSRLRTAKQQYDVELEFDRLYSAHFSVMYRHATTEPLLVHKTVDRLETIYREVGRMFGSYPAGPFTVILYPDQEFWDATGTPTWVGGLFDGHIHVPVLGPGRDDGFWDALLRHEYTHALVDDMSAGRVPVWLSEGLAIYCEGRPQSPGFYGTGRHEAGTVWPSARDSGFVGLSPEAARQAYMRSYQAAERLIRQYGFTGVRTLLKTLSRNPDFPTAFESTFHTTLGDFEAARLPQSTGQRF